MARDSREGNAARRPAARAISVDQTSYADAERNYRRRLTRPEQLRLAHEAATTRSAELRLAYPGLISVGSGFRTRRMAAGGQPLLTREPCVIFVVAKKWKTVGRPSDPRRLPTHLLAAAGPDEQRMLCAIPTDVRPLSHYGRPRPKATGGDVPMPFGVLVERTGDRALVRGVATCGVQRPGLPNAVFAMSCRHVLSRSLRDADGNQTGLPVLLNRPNLPRVGATLATRGALLASPGFSFDVQLTKLSDGAGLKRAMSGLKFTAADAFLHDPGDVGLWLLDRHRSGRSQRSAEVCVGGLHRHHGGLRDALQAGQRVRSPSSPRASAARHIRVAAYGR